ncbi:MAG: DUF1080 domain-containing protein [Bacteroidales bacterium]|nr:DUF1080 domain-containing protein [Bacteroidales bacterium]
MKKIFLSLVTVLMLPFLMTAQDGRNRTVTTIIADAMAQLPAGEQALYNSLMDDLAKTGSEGVIRLAGMMTAPENNKNNLIEYALNGMVAYATAPGNEAMARNIADGLVKSIEACNNDVNKAFLISLLARCGNNSDIAFLEQFLSNPVLGDPALNAISQLPGANDEIAKLIKNSKTPDITLVRMAGELQTPGVEDIIIAWTALAPANDKHDYYRTLSRIGGLKSLAVLENAAKKEGYKHTNNDATNAYIEILNNGMGKGFDAAILKSAQKTLGSKAPNFVRGGALVPVFALQQKKALPELIKAVKSNDRQYRVNALRLSTPWADNMVQNEVNKAALNNKDVNAITDVINWYAANGVQEQADFVTAAIDNADETVSDAAIKGAGKIAGDKALKALAACLYTPKADKAAEALLFFKGDITPVVNEALAGNDAKAKTLAMKLANNRHIKASLPHFLNIIAENNDGTLKTAAYKSLANVASAKDLDTLVKLGTGATGENRAAVSNAIKAVMTPLTQEEQYASLKPYLANASTLSLFYPALAQCGNAEAVSILRGAYDKGDQDALAALLTVKGNDMIPVLYEIATKDSKANTAALKRYAALISKSGFDGSRRFNLYAKGLEATTAPEVQNLMLNGMGDTQVFPVLETAMQYINNPATAASAAGAIRTVASKNNFTGDDVVKALEAAKAYYVAEGSADSGYAVDDINGMIAKMSIDPTFTLSPEEEAEGFEVLFDGTSLERWKGNKTNYVPMDGSIYVTAQYGGGGNLYTDKEYSDFIYRFEFCFDTPGVNNGIGIRTSEGVDAAYNGMEIQVLDHDDPIYAGLKPHQVHGSVYGIIPAKRIKSPGTGVWNTEEIRAVGDHITVTVNGEVILDGDIRKACKGHNVAPDGSGSNPYTVDHLNHPGLFNKKGLISFCGHGPGVRFRNIRIKDLSK